MSADAADRLFAKYPSQDSVYLSEQLQRRDIPPWQFELICADSISVFINGEVLRSTDASYLNSLFKGLRRSQEFQPVTIQIGSVPEDDRGARFLRQFFGKVMPMSITQVVARKKARIMQHWGSKLGIDVEIVHEHST